LQDKGNENGWTYYGFHIPNLSILKVYRVALRWIDGIAIGNK